jgi:hypothetical protein
LGEKFVGESGCIGGKCCKSTDIGAVMYKWICRYRLDEKYRKE